ncbi:5'-nucleotidase SurE [Polystyrenella longa]|uniref:5'-nucleotidase SurE n=1 Tax=Polystyrenella longa TaxID=2528007 RepID=A0A518CQ03_9PLAN|nr:5'/3'-nucleotidase SurE [Polystyrenella longa]QDU81300.1 5'-nucleotidase SurE [Polystyrenella longa]
MHILLTNDDGIYAPGLAALKESLAPLGKVTVVAPAAEQSGVGLSITYRHPLMAREEYIHGESFGYAVYGSPADCVKMGVLEFCGERPDLIVSGINSGANIGINVLYSGTVAAAIEGAFFGITSIAVSQSMMTAPDYDKTAERAAEVIQQLLDHEPETGSLWNLNFPHESEEGPKGLKVVSIGCNRQEERLEKRTDPRGKPYYWCGLEPISGHSKDPGSDIEGIQDGYATLSPLHFDLTETKRLEEYRQKSFAI